MYFNDREVTKLLLREKREFERGERKSCSNELAKEFINLTEKILSGRKYVNYTDDWKNDFRSFANFTFVKYWYKFDPIRIKENVNRKEDEYIGAHRFFSSIVHSAIHTVINKRKREKEKHDKIIKNEMNRLFSNNGKVNYF